MTLDPHAATRYDLVVRARRIISGTGERAGALGIRGEQIAAILPHDAVVDADAELVLSDDEVLMPGLIDAHVHVNEPGRTDWEGYATATAAAAAGGITTLIDMPLNSIPSTTTVAALQIKKQAATGQCSIDVGFWGGAVPGNVGELKPLQQAGVFGFKCFLAPSGVDEFPHLSSAELREHLAELASFGGLLIVHAEDCGILDATPNLGGQHYADFVASRPRAAENQAIADVIDAAKATGGRVHILHLSSSDALPLIRRAKQEGVKITAETCPHYLTFASEHVPDGSTQYKCCPPIREEENRHQLWQGLLQGDLDWVASDHSPCTPDLKRFDVGDFDLAWGGISSVQLVLPAVWTGAREHGADLPQVVRWLAEAPAEQLGIPNKGRLEVGYDADWSIFAPDETFTVDVSQLHHKNPVTPYHGRTLSGVVRGTWLRGEQIISTTPRGRFLSAR